MSKIPKDILDLLDHKNSVIDKNFKNNLKAQLFNKEETVAKKSFSAKNLKNYFKHVKLTTGLATMAVLLVVGTVSATVGSDRAKQASEKKVEIPANLSDVLSINDIREKALAAVPNGNITGIELENEHGVLLYKVKFSDGSFRLFDAKTGEPYNKTSGLETDGSVPADFSAQIDLSKAREIAQNQRPGKSINKVELETESGVVVYSFRFSDGGRVDVNATDGSVVRVRNGDDSGGSSSSSSSNDSNDDNSGSRSDDSGDSPDDSDNRSGSRSDDSGDSPDDSDNRSGSNSGSGSSGSGRDDKSNDD